MIYTENTKFLLIENFAWLLLALALEFVTFA